MNLNQAYIQSKEKLKHKIYVKKSKKFGLKSDKVLKLKKGLFMDRPKVETTGARI